MLEFVAGECSKKGGGAMNRSGRRWGIVLGLGLLATACLPQGMRVPQSEFLAALERKAGLIAYLGTDGNIYTIDQGGGEPTPVTTDARVASDYLIYGAPAWSPDSQSLAFARFTGQGTSAPSEVSLFVADKAGQNLLQAYTSGDYLIYYDWSPDGRHISFLSDTPSQNLALKIVPAAGGEAETLDVGAPYYWTWSPNSQTLLVHAGGATAEAHLSVLRLGSVVTEHGLEISPSPFKAPAYSPDGHQALVAGQTPDRQSALLLTDALGQNPQPLTEYAGNIAFAWSPDGKRIAYIASEADPLGLEGKLVIVDPAGKQKPVELKGQSALAFFWSPDSKSVAYFSRHILPTPTPEAGQSSSVGESATILSLNVIEARNGATHEVATFVPTERFLQVIPYFDQYHKSTTIWSPDSRNLVVSAYTGDGTPGIWVVAASGNLEPRFIAPGLVGFWSWK